VQNNLACLRRILQYNVEKGFLFFRISSDMVPFASHPVCTFDWAGHFRDEFKETGRFIREHDIRISMHPDQFVLINAIKEDVVARSIAELAYHCTVLDALELDSAAKIQIHVGGVYGDKGKALARFIERYESLARPLKRRLVIENDDRLFGLEDCLVVHEKTGIPILFDSFHHECLNNGEKLNQGLALAAGTWNAEDGVPMVDYSTQQRGQRLGTHATSIDPARFLEFLQATSGLDFDLMLEIKDKEKSALKALQILKRHRARQHVPAS
jgi:UV DNA damage endonuclease